MRRCVLPASGRVDRWVVGSFGLIRIGLGAQELVVKARAIAFTSHPP